MKYQGSKNRLAREILPFIDDETSPIVDLFCGGANFIDKVSNNRVRIANDSHQYLISFLKALQNGWEPPKDVSEEYYKYIKNNQGIIEPHLVGYVGFNLSYGGKWWGGYSRDKLGKRNYGMESYNNVLKQAPKLKGIEFTNLDYRDVIIPIGSIVYCDIPYYGTTGYKGKFNYDSFYSFCREIGKTNKIFISEFNMPNDFKCIWQKERVTSLTKNTGSKKNYEKLFILK